MNGLESPKRIIPFIEEACEKNLYPGLLEWLDKEQKIFFLAWIHKSCEQWDKANSKVFVDWAACKGKMEGKDHRDLKAAFRNALHSKKKNGLKLIKKNKKDQHWQILSEAESPTTKNITPKEKVTKAKKKGRPKKSNRSCNTQMPSTSFAENPTNTVYSTRYNRSVTEALPLPPCQSLFHVSPPTPPLQQTDVLLKTLDGQAEFFYLQESEVIPSSPSSVYSAYSVPSPVSESNSQEIQGMYNPTYNAFCESVTHPETFDSLLHSTNYSLDFTPLGFIDGDQEQVVPMSQNYLCNYEFNARQTQGTNESQFFHKQRETELFSSCQTGMEQIPFPNVPENSLCSLIENMPRQSMLYDDIDEDIFKFLHDIPEMER